MKDTDIAIVGMSCFLPGANNINDYWNNLMKGVSSITEVPEEKIDSIYFKNNSNKLDHIYCNKGGFIPPITIDTTKIGISAEQAQNLDPIQLLIIKLVYQALEDASVFEKKISLKKCSIIIGKENYISSNDLKCIDIVRTSEQLALVIKNILPSISDQEIEKVKEAFQKDRGAQERDIKLEYTTKSIAGLISSHLKTEGTAYTIDASEVSSLLAVEQSIQELLNNKVEIAIAGGMQFSQNSPYWSVFSNSGLLSHKQEIKPFNEEADGILLSEGAGFVVLKRLSKALSDNDRIYAVIKGVGIASNGNNSSNGQKTAILEAWKNAKINPGNIGYIEANGTAIKNNDKIEVDVLSELFKDEKVLIGSVKSNIGHTLSASGMASIIKTALSLYNKKIPATLHCEKPNDILKNTKIMPVSELTDWNEKEIPLNAGVSTFGIDGMSAHIVLQAHGHAEETHKSVPVFQEDAIAISAASKEDLIEALDKRNFSISDQNGNYRLVLFNPTSERIEKAKKLISKDKPWKGRQDIWFSNKPLLRNNEKIAFLFPGFDPSSNPEVESIAKHFGYEVPKERITGNLLLDQSFKQFHGGEIIDGALKKMGIRPDLTAGHSLGEWFAAKSGGLVSDESVENLLNSMDPEKYNMDDVYFIAVGAGTETVTPILDKIQDLYLSNDNCPNQVLLCGTETAKNQLIQILKSKSIFYQVLDFKSGFHSPFLKKKLYLLEDLNHIKIEKNDIPVWSATTLDVYPNDFKSFKELTIQHLTQAVLFRELIEKLYEEENVRFFIQIGSGSLIGFVDDILKNKEYAAISSTGSRVSTLEQLRRVLSLLFIEGKDINISFIGIKNKEASSSNNEILVFENQSLIKNFPLLQELSYKNKIQATESDSINSLFIKSNHPVVQAMNDYTKELILMQKEFTEMVETRKTFASNSNSNIIVNDFGSLKQYATQPIIPNTVIPDIKVGSTFEEKLDIDLKNYPYIIDHSLFKQPKNWKVLEDIGPVIPMTMTFELLIEAAHKQNLTKKVLRLGPVSVFQWMKVYKPFQQNIEGTWKTENVVSLKIKNFANGDVTLGDAFPNVDPSYLKNIDFGDNEVTPPTPEIIYKYHMFHGPGYQGILEVTNISKKGLRAIVKKSFGKGSLMDTIGQLYGLYLQLMIKGESKVSFPVKIEEINFYQDIKDQEGIFECICLPTSFANNLATADIIMKRDGKVWCIIKGWKNQIFEGFDTNLWNTNMSPSEHILANEIAPNVYFFDDRYKKAVNQDFLMHIYLNTDEKRHYDSLMLNKKKNFLISRVCIKDCVRDHINNQFGIKYFPIEFTIQHDERNKPSIHGVPETDSLEISIAHKGSNTVSIVSNRPVGIDLEIIEERDKGFLDIAFTEKEINLIKSKDDIAEWSTRFWVAKEAYGKMLGIGLNGNPKQYEVISINGENLTINNTVVKTIKHNNKFIIGWTQ
ncbi:MAG: 4'-phosphopantetheinyl transferase superfamily protein [Apibacter sp.]|nr:4'-phosphopantetheinyl transferase superfamily protein [Apibacter sp.]